MRSTTLFVTALVASATAQTAADLAKQELASYDQEVVAWYEGVAKPLIDEHRQLAYRLALAEAEVEHGPLLETCAAGTKCREENEIDVQRQIEKSWETLLKSFRTDVEANILKTKEIVNVGWQTAVTCELDHPCCEVSEVEWSNIQTQITQTEKIIKQKQTAYDLLTREIETMRTTCPDVDFDAFDTDDDVVVVEEAVCDTDFESHWSDAFYDDIEFDYSYPSVPCYNNAMTGFIDETNTYRWEFTFEQGQTDIVDVLTNADPVTCQFDPADVRTVYIFQTPSAYDKNIRKIAFHDW
jgi:hypothetical protein